MGKLKIGKFEIDEWEEVDFDWPSRCSDGKNVVWQRFGPDWAGVVISIYPPDFEGFAHEPREWKLCFHGPFGNEYGSFETTIQIDLNDTPDQAKRKVDEVLERLAKLESFK